MARLFRIAGLACLVLAAWTFRAEAQVGALISPGPLARPHAQLEGLSNCQKCHERGQKVTAAKCLACHADVAGRIARKAGVHRSVTTDCVSCHAEHGGVDGLLRPFDQRAFDHAGVTGFALTGKHVPLALQCAACHKSRSFLTLTASCSSCHADVHKGALGSACASCHSTQVAFKELGGQFDHAKAAFQLTGAHRALACTSCHVSKTFKVAKFASCADCHRDPHRQTFGSSCTTCHTNETWRTKKIEHARTTFPLVGRHATVDCARCHKQPAMKVKPAAATCASCHADVHRGAFRQDCKACHSEAGFTKAPFDHAQTKFTLTGKHSGLACQSCHKTAAFAGLQTSCASCHADVHQAALGTACESCHTTATFRVQSYSHRRASGFFDGQHAAVACEKCHVPQTPTGPARTGATALNVKFRDLSTACASCHRDAHLGQEGSGCERCHTVQIAKFAVARFDHAAAGFPLTGRHEAVPCAQCHKSETGVFPSGSGTAVRFKGVPHECRACHTDPHLGQVAVTCETCHKTDSFKVPTYVHRGPAARTAFFTGRHARVKCEACHRSVPAQLPSGRGTTIRFAAETRCIACHKDVHRGALGPNCSSCHKP